MNVHLLTGERFPLGGHTVPVEHFNRIKVHSKCTIISGISWFPNSSALFVWDTVARFCVDFFYPDGSSKHTVTPAKATDEGIKVASISPCSCLLATFDNNSQIHLYNTLISRLVNILDFRKLAEEAGNYADEISNGIPFLCWSSCSQYLAFASSSSAHVIIWSNIHGDYFNFSIKESCISDLAWHRKKPILAVATGSRQVYLLKCPGSKNCSTLEIDICKFKNSIPVRELRWEDAYASCLVVRKSESHVAVTCIR